MNFELSLFSNNNINQLALDDDNLPDLPVTDDFFNPLVGGLFGARPHGAVSIL